MSYLPKDWDYLDRILNEWAMFERWGLTTGYGPGSAGVNTGIGFADDQQAQWGRLRVQEALNGIAPTHRRQFRSMALQAYTDRPALLREPPIVELRGILLVMIETKPFRMYEMSGPPEPEKVEA